MNVIPQILLVGFSMTIALEAGVIAETSFETSEGFQPTFTGPVVSGFRVKTGDGDLWEAGPVGSYAGVWQSMNSEPDGENTAVIGNTGRWIMADPAGDGGVGEFSFYWDEFSGRSSGDILVQWTRDVVDGTEKWITVARFEQVSMAQSGWKHEKVGIFQDGDVKVRVYLEGGEFGSSFDKMVVTNYVEGLALSEAKAESKAAPTGGALIGVGGVLIFLE